MGEKRYISRLTALLVACVLACVVVLASVSVLRAQDNQDSGFALQVTPSPLVATIKPGESSTLELVIRNSANETQELKMGMRSFTVDEQSGQVDLGNAEPADVKSFVSFAEPNFTLDAGEILIQKITIKTPTDAAFTYSFAITIGRQNPTPSNGSTTTIEGSVAVFTLLSVDRQGAERKFELSQMSASKKMYEYLPADFSIKLRNTGNTLVQPKGTIYIQRGSNDASPLATIPLNPTSGYILPNTNRILTSSWNEGFPHYETKTDESTGQSKRTLVWNWGDLSKLRIGKYTAKVVAVYDDGLRDVPVVAEVTFWVMPWRIILVFFVIVLLFVIGLIVTLRGSARAIKRRTPKSHETEVKK